jgi:proline dehydrogenase
MLRELLIRASQVEALERFVTRQRFARAVALRFIAGETVEDGLRTAGRLAGEGKLVSIDYVGEYAAREEDARRAADVYLRVLQRIGELGLPAGISVKSTLLGRTLDPDLCEELLDEIAVAAARVSAHVSLDMEDHALTEDTVALTERMLAAGHAHVGVAIQAYLHRSADDVRRLTRAGASLRLCKGAYDEPEYLAYRHRAEVDHNFAELADHLLAHGVYPRIATHDHRLIAHTKTQAARLGLARDAFEFQMLYGIRTDLQDALVADGYRLCVYVPFGDNWYAYFMRRLAERPANVAFFLRALRG